MLKIGLTVIVVFISLYWVGERVRLNPKIDAFLSSVEGRYTKLNELMEDVTVREGLFLLRKFYGWASVGLFIAMLIIMKSSLVGIEYVLPSFWLFSFFFMGWFSIDWVADHRKKVSELSKNNSFAFFAIILGPLLMGVSDLISHTLFTSRLFFPLYPPLHQILSPLDVDIPVTSNPLIIGCIISLMFMAFWVFLYLMGWIFATPVFAFSVVSVALPVKFARMLAAIDRNNTFFWFSVFLMFIVSVWLTQI
jgi:tetrahydromethanopterin S-methyltransferase subunit B